MKESGYKIRDQWGVYYITCATVQWVDVFTRHCYAETVLGSLRFCIDKKGLRVHAWCIMSNHFHLILSASSGDLSGIIRDFKKFTSWTIIRQIKNNAEESRKNWMLWIFRQAGTRNPNNDEYQFWQQDNRPIQLLTVDFTLSKLNYIHNNPVKAGLVDKAEEYLLSSARDYYGSRGLLPVEHLSAAYTFR
jgi:putative transposase